MATIKAYSVREIDAMINGVTARIDERLDDQDKTLNRIEKEILPRIEGQTTKTNGNVRWLEKMMWLAMGALSILGWLYANSFIHCITNVCNAK